MHAANRARRRLSGRKIEKPVAKSAALGDSPSPFFNVYRSYMEPGGIAELPRTRTG